MSLPLNTHVLEGAYRYLASTRPFVHWNLPDADEVVFRVTRRRATAGSYKWLRSRHNLMISALYHGHTLSLLMTMAHEMIHLHIEHSDIKDSSAHGPVFRRYAAQICKYHGFDLKNF